jgi:hypothetical protein
MADVSNRPDLGGGREGIWRSMDLVDYLDLEEMVECTLILGQLNNSPSSTSTQSW